MWILLDVLDDGVDIYLRLRAPEHVMTTANDLQVRVVTDERRRLCIECGLAQIGLVGRATGVEHWKLVDAPHAYALRHALQWVLRQTLHGGEVDPDILRYGAEGASGSHLVKAMAPESMAPLYHQSEGWHDAGVAQPSVSHTL
eukprot:CAMPEP_0181223212 /NCGR_PEP_ID=MMETSP1096-20121128/30387_1 /TAXON_ID=156174 ORGANISM="Chrysochromulina ericina, Strain CCMP281" /NCGR_SAMPLE_ID=MMETSP1096 /ASSEMBLY_ACC=CAM_ASM_000453 /LENGTH=142 /DNA_ID=CAMNT_0023316041 /DNA_START=170 /DNA_END=599 /DNA_ORIENTATION=+